MSISAQAVDVVYGRPAAGVRARLERRAPATERSLGGRAPAGPGEATGPPRGHRAPVLDQSGADGWLTIAHAETDSDGQIHDWTAERLEHGPYRIVFNSDSYFATLGLSTVYSEITVAFRLDDEANGCRIQVLLAPYSYSMFVGTRG